MVALCFFVHHNMNELRNNGTKSTVGVVALLGLYQDMNLCTRICP